MTRFVLPTAADTHAFGRRLAGLLRTGDLVLLSGPLGAGKTALTQGIGAGLGVLGDITSPTFVIARVHRPDPEAGRGWPWCTPTRTGSATLPIPGPRSTTWTWTPPSTSR